MSDPKQQTRELNDDLELGVEQAAKAVGGDTKATTPPKPLEYMVVKFNDLTTTAPSIP